MEFTVYGFDGCAYCEKAKELLQSKDLEYVYHDVIKNGHGALEDMQQHVYEASGIYPRTVPQIFVDDRYIGGYDDLSAYFTAKKEVICMDDFDLGDL